jgi:hypothetical protein
MDSAAPRAFPRNIEMGLIHQRNPQASAKQTRRGSQAMLAGTHDQHAARNLVKACRLVAVENPLGVEENMCRAFGAIPAGQQISPGRQAFGFPGKRDFQRFRAAKPGQAAKIANGGGRFLGKIHGREFSKILGIIHDRHALAQLGRPHRRRDSCRVGPKHDKIKLHIPAQSSRRVKIHGRISVFSSAGLPTGDDRESRRNRETRRQPDFEAIVRFERIATDSGMLA